MRANGSRGLMGVGRGPWLPLFALLGVLLAIPPAFAAATTWTSTSVRGVVVYLLDGKWQEVDGGQQLVEATLRTLRSGRLSLEGERTVLSIGPNSALQVGSKGSTNIVQQYEGSVDVVVSPGPAAPLTVRAGTVTLTRITGQLSISMTDKSTSLTVTSGTVAVASAGGHRDMLGPGVYLTDTSGVLVSQTDAVAAEDAPATTSTKAKGNVNPNSNENASTSNAGGNGNGNGGVGYGNGNGNDKH